MTVLLVDDDRRVRVAVTRFLERSGLEVIAASSGSEIKAAGWLP